MTPFLWPITTLDFEASGLGEGTYPIEIGVARWHGPGTDIATWSSLIRPAPAWRASGRWTDESTAIHGLARDAADGAPAPRAVMERLNELCPLGTLAFCDGGDEDLYWMRRLAEAARLAPTLLVGSWGHLHQHLRDEQADRLEAYRAGRAIAHRAGPDAVDHLQALAAAVGAETPEVVRMR